MRKPSRFPLPAAVASLTLLTLSLLPAFTAWADEPDAASGHGGTISPFAGDVGTALWTVVIFVLLLWVLGKYAWGPILRGLQGREDYIRQAMEKAKGDRDEAEQRLREYEVKLAAARAEVDAILDEARRDADVVRQREEEKTRAEAEQMIARAKREIDVAQETALKELYARASHLATDAAGRILKREIKAEDHQRLIAESIAAIERMELN
jgi:F-type H+-transporting ATPase subunit b